MKLSTALKKGSRNRKHITEKYFDHQGGVCAFGAIALGMGCKAHGHSVRKEVYRVSNKNPGILTQIVRLNDREKRSFNYIYKWLKEKGL